MITALWLVAGVVIAGILVDELARWHENRNRVDYLIDDEHDALGYLFASREFRDERTPIADSIDFDMWAGEFGGDVA